jgi:hypothetical protein
MGCIESIKLKQKQMRPLPRTRIDLSYANHIISRNATQTKKIICFQLVLSSSTIAASL